MWFVFVLQTRKPEAVTIIILNDAATAAAAGDAAVVADGDDNFYNILTYYVNQKIK